MKQREIRNLNTRDKKFMSCTTGYRLLYHRRKDILEELDAADPIENKLVQY
jgi:hypothetical protein